MLIDIRSERYKRQKIKKTKNKDRISEIVDLKWYEEKKKKKKDERRDNVDEKVDDWSAKFEMNKHVIDCKIRWVESEMRWCVRNEVIEALSLKWIRKILILSEMRWMIAGYFLGLFVWMMKIWLNRSEDAITC